jgi:hypothetical protein
MSSNSSIALVIVLEIGHKISSFYALIDTGKIPDNSAFLNYLFLIMYEKKEKKQMFLRYLIYYISRTNRAIVISSSIISILENLFTRRINLFFFKD